MLHSILPTALLVLSPTALALGDESKADDAEVKWGHSHLGEAYDEGPRQKPWIMEGIGRAHLPVTSTNPELQPWFDQGVALLHNFWWFEAERTFRWCQRLDPECAMAYWGLARAVTVSTDRGREFLKEAVARKDGASPRERAYIELLEAKLAVSDASEDERDDAVERFVVLLDTLLMDYPDDLEAKAFYWLELGDLERTRGVRTNRYGMEAVFREVMEKDPYHVGMLHYRIHSWDGKEGRYAVDSCLRLSEVAPRSGHLQHMPGHVLSGIGLWHEAAIAMDTATRVEKAYMHERMILPEQNWDYVHNLDYLCYIQEQLGMVEAALLGAEQQLLAPPSLDNPWLATVQKLPTFRALLKFERWEEALDGKRIGWDAESDIDELLRLFAEGRALIGLGRLDEADERLEELVELREALESDESEKGGAMSNPRLGTALEVHEFLLRGLLELERGDALEGVQTLTECARLQEGGWWNDPPQQAYYVYNVLGEAYLELGSAQLAAAAFERTLETVFNDGFALAGLVRAHAALGNDEAASEALAALKVVWSDADLPNRWLDAALATGIEAEPHLESELEQRNYKRTVLDELGPSLWSPAPAPPLTVLDSAGEEVTLADYEDQNLVLIYYLGDECLHCMEQVAEASERSADFRELNTEILAMSKDTPEEIAGYEESGEFDVTLLHDPGFENARRYHVYDDFEECELHATILLDRNHDVHWFRIGGEPFMDFDFLEKELRRLEEGVVHELRVSGAPR